jgi:predicted unusual protein kinase regulating ubiquinone biosynthesis (AarF/ABC1/UbiB family)
MARKPRQDRDSATGRAKRYARVGTAMGGLAARFVGGRFLGIDLDRGAHAAELKVALGGLKGPLMKVAQILATVPDVLPEEYTAELAQLQTNAPSMGWSFVRRRMAAELGPDWRDRFASFERQAAAAASLGQVHRATDGDGRALACKLQYPDMGSAVEADLRQLKLVFAIYRRYDRAIDPSQVHAELAVRLREELDYLREARNLELYRHVHADEPGVHVPEVVAELSTERLLSMTWLEGTPLLRFVDDNAHRRNRVAFNMFRAWYLPLYEYGVIHGDPHLGNYTVRRDASINLFDFGCIRVFKPSFIGAVIDLYRALRDDDEGLAVHAYETWGFRGLDREMIGVLNLWARFLYAPLMEDKVRPIQEAVSTTYGDRVAGQVHRELRRLGGVTPPSEFVLMDRAAIGLGSVFTHLRAEINWHRLFHDLIDNFDEKALARRQKKALKAFGVPLAD